MPVYTILLLIMNGNEACTSLGSDRAAERDFDMEVVASTASEAGSELIWRIVTVIAMQFLSLLADSSQGILTT